VVDINELKQVNNHHGHYVGDCLIQQVAQLLKNAVRQPDILARIGGDEFAILLTNTDALHARGFEKRMTELFAQAGVHATSGKASWQPGEALQDTLRRADRAMCANRSSRQSVVS
jgi:diguanylate cyclase (GGDEF)-like protein